MKMSMKKMHEGMRVIQEDVAKLPLEVYRVSVDKGQAERIRAEAIAQRLPMVDRGGSGEVPNG